MGGAIAIWKAASGRGVISIPAMGGNSDLSATVVYRMSINPRDGGAIERELSPDLDDVLSIPAMGGNRRGKKIMINEKTINPRNGGQ